MSAIYLSAGSLPTLTPGQKAAVFDQIVKAAASGNISLAKVIALSNTVAGNDVKAAAARFAAPPTVDQRRGDVERYFGIAAP